MTIHRNAEEQGGSKIRVFELFYEYKNRRNRREKTPSIFVCQDGSIESANEFYRKTVELILQNIPDAPDASVPNEYKAAWRIAWFLCRKGGMRLIPLIPEVGVWIDDRFSDL